MLLGPLVIARVGSSQEPAAKRCAGSEDWTSLPDGAVLLVAQALPAADRPRCRLVCRGWAAAAGAAVEGLEISLSPSPRAAQHQLATAYRRFPSCTRLSVRFPNFLLAAASGDSGRAAGVSQAPPPPQGHPVPLLGTAGAVGPAAGSAGHRRGVGGGGGFVGATAGGCFAGLTHLKLALRAAGVRTLPIDVHFRLPRLRVLELRGVAPAPALAAAAAPAAGRAAAAGAGAHRDAGGSAAGEGLRLGLTGFPCLEELTLGGLLSDKVLLEVSQVTTLRVLTLEGRAHLERSEFVYLAALRRLSALSRLEQLSILGPLVACLAADGTPNPRLDAAAALGSLACLSALTTLRLSSAPAVAAPVAAPASGAGTAHQPAAAAEEEEEEEKEPAQRHVPCSFQALPLAGFGGLQELALQEPGRLPEAVWAELAEMRGGFGSLGGGGGGRAGGGGGGLRSLSLSAASSGIVDELPKSLLGLTRLHVSGVHLDSLALLTRMRALADLSLTVPAEGCDAARRHNVALLAPLASLTRLELRSAAGDGADGAAASGAGPRAPAEDAAAGGYGRAAAAAGRGGAGGRRLGGGVCGEQLLLNDARLQVLARGCRQLAVLSFRGTVQLSELAAGAAAAARALSALTRLTVLDLYNDSDAPCAVQLGLLPRSLEQLSLYYVSLGLPPQPPAGAGASASASGSGASRSSYGYGGREPAAQPPQREAASAAGLRGILGGGAGAAPPPSAQRSAGGGGGGMRALALARPAAGASGQPATGDPAAAAVTGAGDSSLGLLPRCRVLHLDYCRGAPVGRVLAALGGGAVEELRLLQQQAAALSGADAAAVAALPRLRKLQLSCHIGALPDFTLATMLSRPPPDGSVAGASARRTAAAAAAAAASEPLPLSSLSLRLPATPLSLAALRAVGCLTDLRSLFLDAPPPPHEPGLLASELKRLAGLTELTLGPVYGRGCCRYPAVLAALGQLQADLLNCTLQQASA
ncbi:hypothetical protein GPECTOR_194g325 [Gonium pectorale]|uniref:F-box domain-containing protein n=1 Tax=Gonium pectorale TaxID=33097 RepID=A0A150FX51_GONPE|nr:hypothetical protein GPECTOR_194g325 [Gonium pectorale]|eukprot:KXZ42157.1 hypothetical protein GPECTOR_194g325 [Gonium pectorale]